MANYCKYCGVHLKPGARFCQSCGKPVVGAPASSGNNTAKTAPPPLRNDSPAPSYARGRQTDKKKSSISILNLFLAGILVAESVLVCFWHPGFLKKKDPGLENVNTEFNTEAEWPYHSAALDITPVDGFHITAEAGALYDDTKFSITPVEKFDETVAEFDSQLQESNGFVLAAFEVDAGLEEDQALPGEYNVTIDLEKCGIPESLYSNLVLYRVTDSGNVTGIEHTLNGKEISYSSYKNSMVMICGIPVIKVIGIPFIIGGLIYLANKDYQEKYGFFPKDSPVITGNTKYGSFTLRWNMKYMDPDQQDTLSRMKEIADAAKLEAEEDYEADEKIHKASSGSFAWFFKKNTPVAERMNQILENNVEYRRLSEKIVLPDNVKTIKQQIETAYEYLGDNCVLKMPKGPVEFLIKGKDPKNPDNLGGAQSSVIKKTYIDLYIPDPKLLTQETQSGIDTKDNLLLTITHELFHICQERYHTTYLTDSNRFDEMTALVLESDAKEYYTLYDIITGDPKLTENNLYAASMVHPIDKDLPVSTIVTNTTLFDDKNGLTNNLEARHLFYQNQGYYLSKFVQFLRKKTGKNVSVRTIMNARSYWTTPGTSGPLKMAFQLDDATFDVYFRQFIANNQDKIFSECKNANNEDWFRFVYKIEDTQLEKDSPVHNVFNADGSFSIKYRNFLFPEGSQAAILVQLDSTAADDHPEVDILTEQTTIRTSFGLYIAQPPLKSKVNSMRMIECYGDLAEKRTEESGYSVWAVVKPEKPQLSSDETTLKVTLPQPVGPAKNGLVDGLVITVSNDNGNKKEYEIKKNLFGTAVDIPLDDLDLKGNGTDALNVTVKEYVLSRKNEHLYLPESGAASIQISRDENSGDITPFLGEWKCMFIKDSSDFHYILTEHSYRRFLLDLEDNSISIDRTLEVVSYHVDGDTLTYTYIESTGKQVDFQLRVIDEDHLQSVETTNVWTRVKND